MNEKTKNALKSKTIWAAIVIIISQLASMAGYDIGATQGWADGFVTLVGALIASDITALLGALWAMYGRYRAVEKIRF